MRKKFDFFDGAAGKWLQEQEDAKRNARIAEMVKSRTGIFYAPGLQVAPDNVVRKERVTAVRHAPQIPFGLNNKLAALDLNTQAQLAVEGRVSEFFEEKSREAPERKATVATATPSRSRSEGTGVSEKGESPSRSFPAERLLSGLHSDKSEVQ